MYAASIVAQRQGMQVKLHLLPAGQLERWPRSVLGPKEAREKLRKVIKEEFVRLEKEYRGQLQRAATEIGIERQQLQQYAKGSVPPAEVVLMAFLKWGTIIRIEDEGATDGEPGWWEFSMSGRDGGFQKPRPKPVQRSLFEALDDLQDNNLSVKILKKGPQRLQVGVEIGFRKVKF